LLKRHLAWEKKNFDADGDGLYDAYAAIWASDALQYSAGGVTHSSAYNYRANKEAARLAKLNGENGTAYVKEAEKILDAINQKLWMSDRGWYAEYKDLLGNKLLHPSAALWTIYHAIDSKVPDAFQAYQALRYIDKYIPHIPVTAKGWNEKNLYLLSETNWQPYTWSLNNVVVAENLHTALAYWQGNRSEEAFQLWRSVLLETMYLGSGPGNFHQLSFYDAIRGELYRDFADGIGMVARSLMEGLFGIQPDALRDTLLIKPGFPNQWDHASFTSPDIDFDFKRDGLKDQYNISQHYLKQMNLLFIVKAYKDKVGKILVNGKPVKWSAIVNAVGDPLLKISLPKTKSFKIEINWVGNRFQLPLEELIMHRGDEFAHATIGQQILKIFDPQNVFTRSTIATNSLKAFIDAEPGHKTLFVLIKQGDFIYWMPMNFFIKDELGLTLTDQKQGNEKMETINISGLFNDVVTDIFRNKYVSPRPTSPTLQLPVQGIGNWAYHSVQVNISDSGLRSIARIKNEFTTSSGIPFQTPGITNAKNIFFTSMWDNYPDSVVIPLTGNSSHAYFLMTGTTNPMQSRITNGEIIINYTDGTSDKLELKNPENWWPIEQDYYIDGFAFRTDAPRPVRISLKTGNEIPADYKYTSIPGFSNFAIDGGAATVLDMPLNKTKNLKELKLITIANDVVIGLMSLTLER